ncbi:hypothetical protein ACLMJK_007041 [Lecanora helva]
MLPGSGLARIVSGIALLVASTYQLSIPRAPEDSILPTRGLNAASNNALIQARADTPRPIWMIAHKCLTIQGIDDAISNGANAVEMDLTSYKEGWWAQHTDQPKYAPIRDLFDHISAKKAAGANIQWVWLDIKTPDAIPDGYGSIEGLQKLVREHLLPHGVGALYGFAVGTGDALDYIKETITSGEAVNYDGSSNDSDQNKTPKDTVKALENVPVDNRVGSYGWDLLSHSFGDCFEDDFYTCTELRQAKASGNWGTVLGWTTTLDETGDDDFTDKLFNQAKVDGMIYGYSDVKYHDSPNSRAAAKIIQDWISAHADEAKLADSMPWTGPI